MSWPPLTRTGMSTGAQELAEVLRRLSQTDPDSLDPWLAFPQNGCSFAFGRPPRPLAIGVLRILWREGAPFTQPCPDCSAALHMISMGGLLTVGGGRLICGGCGADYFQSMGSLSTVAAILERTGLRGTAFAPSRMVFGGSVGSNGAELLRILGLPPLSQPEWGVVRRDDGLQTRLVFSAGTAPDEHVR